nr:PREDICTED: uncharacterized protein LOC109039249 [Bemisia tabaci]
MFYEVKDKRIESATQQTKWWVTAGFCGVVVTGAFIGVTLWLGARQQNTESIITDRILNSGDNFNSFNSKFDVLSRPAPPPVVPGPAEFPKDPAEERRPPSFPPTNKKAKIEKVVDFMNGETVSTSTEAPRFPTYEQGFKPIVPNVRKHVVDSTESEELAEGPDPMEDIYPTGGKTDHQPVAKKSEAIYPAHEWIEEEKVHEVDSLYKPDTPVAPKHNYKFDEVYESQMTEMESRRDNLKPADQRDGKFKLKTIPAFTYMKENKYAEADIPGAVSEDYPYYYQKDQEFHGPNYDGVAPEDAESPLVAFLKKRLKDLNEWFTKNSGATSPDWSDLLTAVNQSLYNKNTSMLFNKFKEMYYNSSSDVQEVPLSSLIYPKNPAGIANNSNLISFGLLAIDLFLLHNVQQIAWNEENDIRVEMLKDPDIMALNALFLPPEKILQMKNPNSRFFTEQEDESKHGALHELMEFVNGGLRAVLNLGKAYRSSTRGVARSNGVNTLDCIWTLYCRNLDKTAKLNGPYGFLAKMNSLGLRLMMGEFPVERAFENLIRESTRGWRELDCQKLFPRCDAEEAKEVVIQTALGQNVPK